ncbi:MAG: Gfo/Idh/MocA family oxidoreductase [Firmicutes bacterium]|nr:Gfo/Idh/MocA family oxidoreductase [Bacillota bacterium]
MPHHLSENLWLIGAGYMALEYAKVLKNQNFPFEVIGRSKNNALQFMNKTGITPKIGGIEKVLRRSSLIPESAIVAVSGDQLATVTLTLLEQGVNRILVEKPAGLDLNEIAKLKKAAENFNARVYVAYNRRFYASVLTALDIIENDGGVSSFSFEFTELSHKIVKLKKSERVKRQWFWANSTHVIDMAFFLGGKPKEICCYSTGGTDWHPSASSFSGAGKTAKSALFSYNANWEAPGRWGIEVLTPNCRLVFRPLEQLHVQKLGSFSVESIHIDDKLDIAFKPGLYRQVEAFLTSNQSKWLKTIQEQYTDAKDIYAKIINSNITSSQ